MAGRGTGTPTPNERAGILVDLLREGRLLWRLLVDPRVATTVKVVLPVLTVSYLLWPLDLVADVIPVLGQLDDLAILALAVKLFVALSPPQVVAEHRASIRRGGRSGSPGAGPGPGEGKTVDGDYRVID